MTLLNMFGAPIAPTAPAQAPAQAPAPRLTLVTPPVARMTMPALTAILTPLTANPKRPGTAAYDCTALYDARPTVADYLDLAGERGRENLLYDIKRGIVRAD